VSHLADRIFTLPPAAAAAAVSCYSPRAEAGKVELDGATYAGFTLPFSITQLVWIEAILVGGAELYRNSELDPERRCYPGATLLLCIREI
jgi:hypothetical protein